MRGNSGLILIVLCIISIWCQYCANPIAPTGGPVDKKPPQIDSLRSSGMHALNFQESSIRFYFDEYIQLKDPATQIVISPPLTYPLNTVSHGKWIEVQWDKRDTLRANTTYSLYFGDAIQDLNEGNPISNFQYVFSTGSKEFQGGVSGMIVDAWTQAPVPLAQALLYTQWTDTTITKLKPYYVTRTDSSGKFHFKYVQPGSYRLAGLLDLNRNYLLDDVKEQFDILPSSIQVSDSLVASGGTLSLSPLQQSLSIVQSKLQSSRWMIQFNQSALGIEIAPLNASVGTPFYISQERDSMSIWCDSICSNNNWVIQQKIENKTIWRDTINMNCSQTISPSSHIQLKVGTQSESLQQFYEGGGIQLTSNLPIQIAQNARGYFLQDSNRTEFALSEKNLKNVFSFNIPVPNPEKFTSGIIHILPGSLKALCCSVSDLQTFGNPDTILVGLFQLAREDQTATCEVQVDDLQSGKKYILQLCQREKEIIRSIHFQSDVKQPIIWKGLAPGDYQLFLIQDDNVNGIWDARSMQVPAEFVKREPLNNCRANWVTKTTLSANH